MGPRTSIASLLIACRPHNGLACGLVLVAGMSSALGPGHQLVAFLALVFLCAAAHLVNDLVDLPADRRNRPARALPAGAVTPVAARRMALALLVGGLLLGLVVIPQWWGWWLFWAVGGVGYSIFAKGRPLVAPLWTSLVIGSCWVAGAAEQGLTPTEWIVFGAMVWFLYFREIIKGVEDARGDLLAGYASCAGRFPGNRFGVVLLAAPLAGAALYVAGTPGDPLARAVAGLFLVTLMLSVLFLLVPLPGPPPKAGSVLKVGAFMGVALLMVGGFK